MKRGLVCAFILAALALTSCTKHPQPVVGGIDLPTATPKLDSLRAKIVFSVPKDGASEDISGVLFAVPNKRYRLELTGPLGMQLASMLWKDSKWTVLVPSEERYTQGSGNIVVIPGLMLPDLSVHRLLSFVWSDVLPKGSDTAKALVVNGREYRSWDFADSLHADTLHVDTLHLGAEFDLVSHRLLALTVFSTIPENNIRLEYSNDAVKISRAGKWLMTLLVTERKPTATWGAGVWKMTVPADWKRF